jgi:ELP3 family radical SAM enzyme/protein acetyltransferase
MYFAANTFFGGRDAVRGCLEEEIARNRDVDEGCRVIGLTLEMRPDSVTRQELYRLRSYGCTRVQLGVQHIDDDILKAINRQCTTARYVKTLRLLKDVGYKVDIHLMANLPFSSPEKDRAMLIDRFLGVRGKRETEDGVVEYEIAEPDLSADQWKLYPCETVPYTEIEKWYREGTYVPYAKDALYQLLYDTKKAMYPWIRCNRIIRDIPKGYIIASSDDPNTGQMILDDLRRNGDRCMCIRCREVKDSGRTWDGTLRVRRYDASGGTEYFISAETADESVLFGFVRLRLTRSNEGAEIFPELLDCGLVRELHVYGEMKPAAVSQKEIEGDAGSSQHKGIGRKLMMKAEDISRTAGYSHVAVIAGVGVQRYYEKLGYQLSPGRGHYMIRRLRII